MMKYVLLTTNNFTKVVLCFGHFQEAIRHEKITKNKRTKCIVLKITQKLLIRPPNGIPIITLAVVRWPLAYHGYLPLIATLFAGSNAATTIADYVR